ncbi:MAG: ABC transporter ATP-binding protein [Clostridium sp.]|nr:ABC transporter ATP-binding protein [Clostridium sp.]
MIEIKELTYQVRDRQILSQIEMHIKKQEFVGIIGPNGSGKSTLLKNIYKVLKPQEGSIFLMGEDLTAISNREMAEKLSVLIQEQESSFDFTVEEVVMMGRHARKKMLESEDKTDKKTVQEILKKIGLHSISNQSFLTLSGGEKQRVLIARAFVQDTPCLILDEPTNHLDIKYQLELMNLVKAQNKTIIAAIHDLNIAALYCTYIYVLKNGQIAAQGPPQEVLTEKTIHEVYGVHATLYTDQTNQKHILFHPQ